MLQQAGLFEKGFDMIKESDALAIARAIYTATKGAESTMGKIVTLGLSGAGTDEEGASSALKSCPTLMDLSFVSYVYEQKYGGSLKDNFEVLNLSCSYYFTVVNKRMIFKFLESISKSNL